MDVEQECILLKRKMDTQLLIKQLGWQTSDALKEHSSVVAHIFLDLPSFYSELKAWQIFTVTITLPIFVISLPVTVVFCVFYEVARNIKLAILIPLYIFRQDSPTTHYLKDEKSLRQLWQRHGYNHNKVRTDDCIKLLNSWIDTLYSPEIRKQLDLESLHQQQYATEVKLNLPYYKGDLNACHFHTGDKFDNMLKKANNQLPLYNRYN